MRLKTSLCMHLKISGLSAIISLLLLTLPSFAQGSASIAASSSIGTTTSEVASAGIVAMPVIPAQAGIHPYSQTSELNSIGISDSIAANDNITASASTAASLSAAVTESMITSVRITAVGDIMMHQRQLDTHYDKALKTYVFDDDYIHIQSELDRADLLIGNMETTFAGPGQKYAGYPLFNTPDALGEAIKRVGFDVLSTANNHCLDTGVAGLKRTVKVLKDLGFGVLGTRQTPEETGTLLTDVKGIKVGMLSYTYETGRRDKSRTLNGNVIPKAALPLIDSFSPDHQDEALVEMKGRIAGLQKEGAELIVMYMHWGIEYGPKPTTAQNQLAQALASAGVDIIFGSHPHVVQTATFIPRADGKRTFVAWSMGNFISNQRYEFLNRHDTEDGLVVSVTVERNPEGVVIIDKVDYQPIWVHRNAIGSRWHYHILPLPQALLDPEPYKFSSSNLARARKSLIRTQEVIKDAPGWNAVTVPGLPLK